MLYVDGMGFALARGSSQGMCKGSHLARRHLGIAAGEVAHNRKRFAVAGLGQHDIQLSIHLHAACNWITVADGEARYLPHESSSTRRSSVNLARL